MATSAITVEGALQPDGVTLQLAAKLALPSGRVTVTVQSAEPRLGPTAVEVLDRIHFEQERRGRTPMTDEAMVVEIVEMSAEDD